MYQAQSGMVHFFMMNTERDISFHPPQEETTI